MRGQTRTTGPSGPGLACGGADSLRVLAPGRKSRPVMAVVAGVALIVLATPRAAALGTIAGTDIVNAASVTYRVGPTQITENSNTVTVTVAEIVDLVVTVQSPQTPVDTGVVNQELLFTLTNTGNGNETFGLALNSVIGGDDFDPVPAATSIWFDSDASGDLSAGDTPYVPSGNDPSLAPDESVAILVVNDIPAALGNGDLGRSMLMATSTTGTGVAGTVIAGAGDGGVDAIIGNSGGDDDDVGEYVISTVDIAIVKSASVSDPFGGTEPVPGAAITYRIEVTASGSGTATGVQIDDAVPASTSFLPASITLNGSALSDAADADAGQFLSAGNAIEVQLGDLTAASGTQVVQFTVVID